MRSPAAALLGVLVTSLALLAGCSDEEETTTAADTTAADATPSATTTTAQEESLNSSTEAAMLYSTSSSATTQSVNEGVRAGVRAAPALESKTTCPQTSTTYSKENGTFELILDYGTGCQTRQGQTFSGSITSTGTVTLQKVSYGMAFANFSNGTSTVNGSTDASLAGATLSLTMKGSVQQASTTYSLDLTESLAMTAGATTLTNYTDDSYSLNLSGTVTASGASVSISVAQAVYQPGTCTIEPTSGTLQVTQGSVTASGTFGGCDGCIQLQVGSTPFSTKACWVQTTGTGS